MISFFSGFDKVTFLEFTDITITKENQLRLAYKMQGLYINKTKQTMVNFSVLSL